MIAIIALIALYAVIHYGLKYMLGWTPIDIVYDFLGDLRAEKEKTRENLTVLLNFITRADNVTKIEIEQMQTVLTYRNPLPQLSQEDAGFVRAVLNDIVEKTSVFTEAQRREAAEKLDAAINRLL